MMYIIYPRNSENAYQQQELSLNSSYELLTLEKIRELHEEGIKLRKEVEPAFSELHNIQPEDLKRILR